MTRTQIQLPDQMYAEAKALADFQEISLAELVRNGLAYMLRVSAKPQERSVPWTLPPAVDLGASDPFEDPDWRSNLHCPMVAESDSESAYNAGERTGR